MNCLPLINFNLPDFFIVSNNIESVTCPRKMAYIYVAEYLKIKYVLD